MLAAWFLLQLLAFASCVSVEDFFPFGEGVGDLKLPNRKHAFGNAFDLNGTYSFYNRDYNALKVSKMHYFHAHGSFLLFITN